MKTAVRRGGLLDEKGSSFVASHVRADFAHMAFLSEDDANALIVGRADLYNSISFGVEPSRRTLFEETEAELLLLLPEREYGFDRWARRTVQWDHHFLYGGVRYSVPLRYAFEEERVRVADGAIEAYHMGELVARHVMPGKGSTARTVTDEAHRPSGHRWFAKNGWREGSLRWRPSRDLGSSKRRRSRCASADSRGVASSGVRSSSIYRRSPRIQRSTRRAGRP